MWTKLTNATPNAPQCVTAVGIFSAVCPSKQQLTCSKTHDEILSFPDPYTQMLAASGFGLNPPNQVTTRKHEIGIGHYNIDFLTLQHPLMMPNPAGSLQNAEMAGLGLFPPSSHASASRTGEFALNVANWIFWELRELLMFQA